MKKILIIFTGLIILITSVTTVAATTDEFKSNIRSLINLKPINYASLSSIDKQVINYSINAYLNNFVSCAGTDYARGEKEGQTYQLNGHTKHILFFSMPVSKKDNLNGILWRGNIVVGVGSGSARKILTGGNYGKWYTIGDSNIKRYGDDGGLYKGTLVFYKNDLYSYSSSSVQGTPLNKGIKLSCQYINAIMNGGNSLLHEDEFDIKRNAVFKLADMNSATKLESKRIDASTDLVTVDDTLLLEIKKVSYIRKPNIVLNNSELEGESRVVSLKMIISDTGKVISVWIVKSSGLPNLDQTMMSALKKAIFSPYEVNGVPVPVSTVQSYELNLSGQ